MNQRSPPDVLFGGPPSSVTGPFLFFLEEGGGESPAPLSLVRLVEFPAILEERMVQDTPGRGVGSELRYGLSQLDVSALLEL